MSSTHATPVRGLMSVPSSPLFQGRFGRMFRALPAARFGSDADETIANLTKLGKAMVAEFDEPKDGEDEEESGIPTLYTYLGQFIDHDLTFDPNSSLQKQNDPDALTDFRNPMFDLDAVYGRGPDDQPYMYDGGAFLLGDRIGGGTDPKARDLPRNVVAEGLGSGAKARRALIGDPRNDENHDQHAATRTGGRADRRRSVPGPDVRRQTVVSEPGSQLASAEPELRAQGFRRVRARRVLKQANLVVDRAVGTRRLYALNPDAFDSLRDYFNQLWTQALAAFKQAAEAQPREDEEDA